MKTDLVPLPRKAVLPVLLPALLLGVLALTVGPARAAGLDAQEADDLRQARQLYKSGNYQEAADIFSRLSAAHPDVPTFARNAGAAYYYLKKPDPALSNLREYLRAQKNLPAGDREEVEKWIAEMEQLRSQATPAPPAAPAATPAAAATAPTVIGTPAAPVPAPSAGVPPAPPAAPAPAGAAPAPLPPGYPPPGYYPYGVPPGQPVPGYPPAYAYPPPAGPGSPPTAPGSPPTGLPGAPVGAGAPAAPTAPAMAGQPPYPPAYPYGYAPQPYPAQPAAPAPTPAAALSEQPTAQGSRGPLPWIIGGAGLATIGLGGVFTYLYRDAFDDTRAQYDPDRESQGKTYSYLQFVCYGLGAAGVTTAAILLLSSDNRSTGTSVTVAPALGPQLAGAELRVRY